jgi:hypothetical protein
MDGFSNFEGASEYSFSAFDDTASLRSGTTAASSKARKRPEAAPQVDPLASAINNLDLNLDNLAAHDNRHTRHGPLEEQAFDGMLDDLSHDLPDHACRCVFLLDVMLSSRNIKHILVF